MPDPKVLSGLRERLASLRVLSCRLAHERVLIENGIAKRRSQGVGFAPLFVGAGLCPREVRSRQLSCAHTLARDTFKQAIEVSEQQGVLGREEASRLQGDLQRLAHTIHSTDWAKSAAEVRYALRREQETKTEVPASAAFFHIICSAICSAISLPDTGWNPSDRYKRLACGLFLDTDNTRGRFFSPAQCCDDC